jgi:dTDP-4-dehydrorhamnose 3,5-epimerase
MSLAFEATSLAAVILVKPQTIGDSRGWFRETYKAAAYAEAGIAPRFVQDNASHSAKGVLRGLHFQRAPHAQGKLVSVMSGEVFDVAVDIRVGSPTYGKWVGAYLSADNGHQLWIPEGFAHGFCVTSDSATLSYKVTAFYDGPSDGGVRWNDPGIGIDWPVSSPALSPKDEVQPFLADSSHGFVYQSD